MDRANATSGQMVMAVVLTCAVAASALSITYDLTKDRIEEQELAAEVASLEEVLSEASEFIAVEDSLESAQDAAGEADIGAIYRAESDSGDLVGWGVRVAARGYGGPIRMVVGLDRDGQVTGVSIITHSETPGLGSKVLESQEFMTQFGGWDGLDIDVAAKGYDAVIGATKSSNGVRKGVLAAGHVYAEVLSALQEGGALDE
ncbi:MAG: FMN-binding protein [Actinomycetota bacterium]|nr:FMN-binding protein [Actinomycetota bacterium]